MAVNMKSFVRILPTNLDADIYHPGGQTHLCIVSSLSKQRYLSFGAKFRNFTLPSLWSQFPIYFFKSFLSFFFFWVLDLQQIERKVQRFLSHMHSFPIPILFTRMVHFSMRNELTLAHHNHPKPIVYYRIHCVCEFYGVVHSIGLDRSITSIHR